MSEEEKKAIEYYKDKEVTFEIEGFDVEAFKKALGITEEDSFENHQIRFKTLINLIEKQDKIIDLMAEYIKRDTVFYDTEGISSCDLSEEKYCKCSKHNNGANCKDCIKEYFRKKVENEQG